MVKQLARYWFAAGAPQAPAWFIPCNVQQAPAPTKSPWEVYGSSSKLSLRRRKVIDQCFDFHTNTFRKRPPMEYAQLWEAVSMCARLYDDYKEKLKAWQLTYDTEQFYQWRWYYAQQMMSRRTTYPLFKGKSL